jgi:hypothetical protein
MCLLCFKEIPDDEHEKEDKILNHEPHLETSYDELMKHENEEIENLCKKLSALRQKLFSSKANEDENETLVSESSSITLETDQAKLSPLKSIECSLDLKTQKLMKKSENVLLSIDSQMAVSSDGVSSTRTSTSISTSSSLEHSQKPFKPEFVKFVESERLNHFLFGLIFIFFET